MSAKPDAPIASSSDDLLGRLPFVDEIVDLAITTPKHWSPRIGIYGSWGSGKTSVLNMVQERLGDEHHVVARFNPWGFHDADEMFRDLADKVLAAIETQGKGIKKWARKAEKISKTLEKSAKTAGEVSKHAGEVGVPGAGVARHVSASAGYITGVLRRVFEKKKIAELLESLEALPDQTRCVVLVDDIDRAEPSLLPPLLFALHEVLIEMPITFVIALDPVVVGAALKQHHPGFGDGLEFLEKMIQFPHWLPDVTDDDRWRLAATDVAQYLPVLDREALRQEFDRFPRNPRELRTLLRGMWGLNAQAKRYRDGEISWNLVLRLAVLRHRHRRTMEVLLEDEERLTKMIAFQLAARHGKKTEAPIIDPSVEQALREREVDLACLPEVLEAIGTRLFWDGKTVIRHAQLVEQPPALTRLEMTNLITPLRRAEDPIFKPADLRAALVDQAKAVHRSLEQVGDEALSHALAMHDEFLSSSADAVFEPDTRNEAGKAAAMIVLIGAILEAQADAPSPGQFRRVLLAFSRWAHFDSEIYRATHAAERQLLVKLCRAAHDPGAFLEVLEPWNRRHAERPEQAVQLRGELERILEPAVDAGLDRIFERPDGVGSMLEDQRSAERWCLLKRAAWSADRIAHVARLDRDAASDNALDLLRVLANAGERARPSKHGIDHAELDAMAADVAITDALWTVMARRPLNMRFFSSVEQIRTALEERRGTLLPDPPWWKRVRGIRDAANAREKQEGPDGSDGEPTQAPDGD
jgi:Cdc6-like AAA superfamily ATPase